MGSQLNVKHQLIQQKMAALAIAQADPTHDVYIVDSVAGNAGNDGLSNLHAVNSLVNAYALASAGDTIILDKRGTETLTATLTIAKAGLKIFCPVDDPANGYTISGAGTLDLLTIAAAGVEVHGVRLAHTGATSDAAGIKIGDGYDDVVITACECDDSAIVTNYTGFGIEVTNEVEDLVVEGCRFKDCHRGILFVTATGKFPQRPRIKNNVFFVGQATAFGIYSNPTSTGELRGLEASDNLFIEALGNGDDAADAWDGTNGTDGASGPIYLGARVQQGLVQRSTAYTASAVSFDLLATVNGSATVSLVRNATSSGGDVEDKVDIIDTNIDTLLAEQSGTAGLAAFPAAAAAANDVSIAEVIRYIQENGVDQILAELSGTAGVTTWPAGTAPTDGVSIAEAVRYISENLATNNAWDVRTIKSTDVALTAGSVEDVFTVANGPVAVLGLFAHVTTAVSNDACNAKFQSDPTVGAASSDLCGNLDIDSAAIGDVLSITGTSGTAMAGSANGTAVGNLCATPQVVLPGGVDLVLANSDPTAGIADVYIVYRPLAADAAVS